MTSWQDYKPTTPRFATGDLVRVKGTPIEQAQLYGREVAGEQALGIITKPARRSQGHTRYLVHFPAHIYRSPVKGLESQIADLDAVIREEHLEAVDVIAASGSPREGMEATE